MTDREGKSKTRVTSEIIFSPPTASAQQVSAAPKHSPARPADTPRRLGMLSSSLSWDPHQRSRGERQPRTGG